MILVKIVPVVLMVCLGLLCRKMQIITQEGIEGLKTLATGFMLPVLLFNALATTSYSGNTMRIVAAIFAVNSVCFGLGMVFRRRFPSLGRFLPFILSSYEGGMLGYPLYVVLCGEGQLFNIATLDIANTIFVFTVYLAILMSTVNGRFEIHEMVLNVLHSPVFWGVFLGIAVGLTGLAGWFLETLPGAVYSASKDMLTSAISAIILIVTGYGLSMDRSVLKACQKAVALRLVLQLAMLAGLMRLLGGLINTREMRIALILYILLPPTFVVPVYARTEEDGAYLSTTISIYSVVTVMVFIIISIYG